MSSIQSVLIIGKVWPEPGSSAAGSRMMQLINAFQERGWEITFATAAGESEFAEDLTDSEISIANIELNDSSFDEFVKNLNPDMVLFDRFMTEEQFGWRVAEQCPDALRVLDMEDLHCLRHGRHQALKEGRAFQESDLLNDYAYREIASTYRCDLSLVISACEMKLLNEFFKMDERLLHYLPFMVGEVDGKSWAMYQDRKHFVSIGNFLHEPNWDATRYLKETIWPLIRKQLPQAELHVYGAYPSQKVTDLNNPGEGFLVKGRVEDALGVIGNSKVMLAPIRFGAGLKGKLLDAMRTGTPSVTTSIGAEGMHGALSWPGAVKDDPKHFAESAIELYSNQEKWEKSQSAGADILQSLFLESLYKDSFIQRLTELKETLETHREKNFTGAMLQHHTMASTRFMGKWIEAKNRKL